MGQNCNENSCKHWVGKVSLVAKTHGMLVVATLKLHVKSRKISRCDHNVFHLQKLKDSSCSHEYAVTVSNQFEMLDAPEDPVELWDTFKRETLEPTRGCVGGRLRSWGGFTSAETLGSIKKRVALLGWPGSVQGSVS